MRAHSRSRGWFGVRGHAVHARCVCGAVREAATLAGLMGGFVLSGLLFPILGPGVFLLNAGLYAVSLLIYQRGVPKDAEPPPRISGFDG